MPTISKEKKDRISEQILQYLFQNFPKQLFTSDIAREIARDEEFVKVLLHDLAKKEIVIKINKNSEGTDYIRRARWRLSNKIHEIYLAQINIKSKTNQVLETENAQKTEQNNSNIN